MAAASGSLSPFAVFRNTRFRLMWSAQLVSTIGDSLVDIAAAILVYRVTGSALAVGLVLMATAAPALLVGLFAGVVVDRYDRKRIMVICDLLRGVFVLAIPFLISLGIGWLYLAVAVVSAIGTFFNPAHGSVLPEIASDEELAAANSMLAISGFGSTAVGFAAGGLIAAAANIDWAFYFNAATFFVSAAIISRIEIPKLEVDESTKAETVLLNLKAGFSYLWSSDILRSFLLVSAGIAVTFGLHNALLLPFAVEALGASEFVFGLQEGLTSVAFVIGSLFMASRADRLRAGQWLTIAFIGMGVVGVLYSLAHNIPWAIVLIMVSGFFNAPSSIAGRLIIQRQTTREVRGRVSSTFSVASNVFFLVGMVLVGLADFFDIRLVYLVAAVATLAIGVATGFLPGLGQPAAEWRRAVALLRGAAAAPGLVRTRGATPADYTALAVHLPAIGTLTPAEIRELASTTLVAEAPTGSVVVRTGEESDAGYFILSGRAVAGRDEAGRHRPLETLNAGDFFGEIAALTGVPRTANVVAEEDTTLIQVPAAALRRMSAKPELNRLFLSKMTERMVRMDMVDMPRSYGLANETLLELRTPREPVVM
ncbi:MAG TPA: MFS transporter [Trueperaceae bacterium]|nr:MFS transporter [Trueperaceae bacterium]